MILAQARYIDQLNQLLSDQPAVVLLGLLLAIVMTIVSIGSPRARLLMLTGTLYMATLQRPIKTPWYSLEMTPDLQFLSNYSRVLTVAGLIILSIAGLFGSSGNRRKLVSAALLGLLMFEYLNCIKIATGGNLALAMNSVIVFTLIFLSIPIATGKVAQRVEDINGILFAIVGAGSLVMLGTVYQLLVRRGAVFAGASPRLYATLGHPQKAGLLFALIIPIAIYLTIHWKRYRWAKPLLIGIASLAVVGLAASGSRTALLALLAGLGVLFRHRLSLGLIVAMVAIGGGLGILEMLSDFKQASGRLFITANTRADSWARLYQEFVDNPVFGANYTSSGTAESSFLGAAARMGIIGVVAVSILVLLIGLMLTRLNRVSRNRDANSSLADLLIGGIAAMGVACVFDQYLFDTITFFNMYLYIYLCLGAAVIELTQRDEAEQAFRQRAAPPATFPSGAPVPPG